MSKPIVALVGRPNVGKSTLFNRLAEERLAVVDEIPGTTRDRLMTEVDWSGVIFDVVDTGGIDPTQTGPGKGVQPLSIGSAEFITQIRSQAEIAIKEADVVLFITDIENGVTPADYEIAEILRRHQHKQGERYFPPILLIVNKVDNKQRREQAAAFYELGMGDPIPISAMHGTGITELLDRLIAEMAHSSEEQADTSVKIAIVGKPNVGKSSLLNKLIGEERVIVSEIPGTTRDAIDSRLDYNGVPITLIDTAGIRRRGKVAPGVEKYSVIRSMRAIERSDVALLLIDALSGITAQDTHIAGYILDSWKSVIIVVNKWDAIEKDTYTMDYFTQHVRNELKFLEYAPILFVSALTGQRVNQVIPAAIKVQGERQVKLTTSQLNKVLHAAQDRQPPPSQAGQQFRIYYATQVRTDPPTFLVYVNNPDLAHFTYLRYLENRIRDDYPFLGTPIRIVLRPRKR